jgi:putative membrane-bound dehydrogenase-like protein
VFVAATPSIWYIKDADGDGHAEIREEIYKGFRKFNIQAVINNLQWGLDHAIYGAGSSNGGQVRPANEPGARAISLARSDFRFRPATRVFELVSGGARFGNTFDDWGNRFLCDIRNPAEHVVLPARYLARNPFLAVPRTVHDAALAGDTILMYRISPPEPWREFRARRWAANGRVMPRSELVGAGYLTSSSGLTVYRGDAYPPEYHGQLFLGEVANNLIHRETLEPDGVTFRARRADIAAEFVASTDTWFRPVNFVNAPDGTLHVLDMYRETIEHPWSIPDDIKVGLDLRSGADRGRIYRLAPPGFRLRPTPQLSQASAAALVALLEHPNAWHRETAHRLIFERQDRSIVPALRALLRAAKEPLGRLHALWSLDGLGSLSEDDLTAGLADPAAGVREHAVALAEPRITRSDRLRHRVIALSADPAKRVRFQVAFTLGEVAGIDPAAIQALAAVARRDADDLWIRTALLSSASRVDIELFDAVATKRPEDSGAGVPLMLRDLAGLVGASGGERAAGRLLDHLAGGSLAGGPPAVIEEVLLGLGEGLGRGGRSTIRDIQAPSPRARDLLRSVLRTAAVVAGDERADLDRRERAVALVAQGEFATARGILGPLLMPGQPQRIQIGAVRSLTSFTEPEVASLLLDHWPALSPALRSEVIARLLMRPMWTATLLDAIAVKTVPAAVIPANRRTLLLADPNAATRSRAQALFGDTSPGPRSEAVARYRPALDLPVDRAKGERVFERECMSCHKLGGRGHAVGPNLASVQRRTAEELLLHILDPDREVAPDYLEYTVALDDGRILTGLIASESAGSLTLIRAEGVEETILRTQVGAIAGTGKSPMPEGLEARISPQEMADLIAFLLGLQD